MATRAELQALAASYASGGSGKSLRDLAAAAAAKGNGNGKAEDLSAALLEDVFPLLKVLARELNSSLSAEDKAATVTTTTDLIDRNDGGKPLAGFTQDYVFACLAVWTGDAKAKASAAAKVFNDAVTEEEKQGEGCMDGHCTLKAFERVGLACFQMPAEKSEKEGDSGLRETLAAIAAELDASGKLQIRDKDFFRMLRLKKAQIKEDADMHAARHARKKELQRAQSAADVAASPVPKALQQTLEKSKGRKYSSDKISRKKLPEGDAGKGEDDGHGHGHGKGGHHGLASPVIGGEHLKEHDHAHSAADAKEGQRVLEPGQGTSPADMRTGFFRLLQGAAYRSFRPNYTAHSETHVRARDLPYTFTDFAAYVDATAHLYLALGISEQDAHVEGGVTELWHQLQGMVADELHGLRDRVRDWGKLEVEGKISKGMRVAVDEIAFQRKEEGSHKAILQQVVDFALQARLHGRKGTSLEDAEFLDREHSNRERVTAELVSHKSGGKGELDYIQTWQAVILDKKNTHVDGAIVPVSFWYEKFMPQLLLCCSVSTRKQLDAIRAETEEDLDAWFEKEKAAGVFDKFATDLRDGFMNLGLEHKKSMKQAWNLSKHYLNGVQKRRERAEFGRDNGVLSHYVTFIDVYLGRNDIEAAEMRISFPYFIGNATWRVFHTTAEIAATYPEKEQKHLCKAVQTFLAKFATMYPCPYCRYHFNRFVGQNREVDMYPLEFIFFDGLSKESDMHRHIPDLLDQIVSGDALRLFFWKLHNTVSSSIERSEPWFHKDPHAIYTNRYWPSLDSELDRARSCGKDSIAIDRIQGIYVLTKISARLRNLLNEFREAFDSGKRQAIEDVFERSKDVIANLDEAMVQSRFLQDTYFFDSCCDDAAGVDAVGAFQEEFARSGHFIIA